MMNTDNMVEQIRNISRERGLVNTLKALDYACKAHEGQLRNNSDIPYIDHPLTVACHAIALGIIDDKILAACLLHDVIEDCGKKPCDLPVDDDIRALVVTLTRERTDKEHREAALNLYYEGVAQDPRASLIKCIDRCHNITTMAKGLSPDRVRRYIVETKKYYPTLLDVTEAVSIYKNVAWLLRYQIKSMLSIYTTYVNEDKDQP